MKKSVLASLLAALVLMPALAVAGLKSNLGITITSTKFKGNLGYVRSTSDAVSFIGCQNGTSFTTCAVKDAAGNQRSCSSSSPEFMAAARSLTPNSTMEVGYNTNGCTFIWVTTQSNHSTPLEALSSSPVVSP